VDQLSAEPVRGVVTATRWTARCKDCGRVGGPDEFTYPDTWIEGVLERGGTRSDRCPACRQQHARDVNSMAVPYIDLDVIGVVANREEPTGQLGGLGPLPIEHKAIPVDNDLAPYDFGIDDNDVRRLIAALDEKQVAVVVAGTGSGKSTFLPYRLMEPPDDMRPGLAARGPIIVTEPRRAAATDTAKFVAEGLHSAPRVGAGCDVGYRVKGENAFDGSCRLVYVTDGSLINWIREGQLDKFGAVIIDEAHERNKNIDIILAVLRAQRRRYPRLKILVASATIDADFFVEYFGGEDEVFRLPVQAEKRFGYGSPLWPCEDVDLAHHDWNSGELHGIPLREYARQLAEMRVVTKPVAPGRGYLFWREQMPKLVVKQAIALHEGTPKGDILAFLPTETTIKDAVSELEERLGDEVEVFGLFRNASEKHQKAARAPRAPNALRRIVVATNIAETSLTIDGISFVVDSGLICQSRWDADTASKSMPSLAHSQDGVKQRWGRVGRKAPGFVFPLYTREQFEEFIEHTPAEAVRDDLEGFVLTSTAIGVEGLDDVVYPAEFQRPGEAADPFAQTFSKERQRAKRAMLQRGALDVEGDVTQMGAELMAYQGTMGEAGAIIGSDELCCSVETAVALSMLMGRQPVGSFLRFKYKWDAATRAAVRRLHEATYAGCRDDLDVALKVYAGWESAQDPASWAARHYVSHDLMLKAERGRAERLEFLSAGRSSPVTQRVRTRLADRVRAVLARALVDFTYVCEDGSWRPLSGDDGISYELDGLAQATTNDRVIALRRQPGRQPKTAYLAALIAAPEWATDCADWTALAMEAAERQRDGHGELVGLETAEHWAFDDAWPIGLRVRAHVDSDARLRADETLVAPRLLRLPDDDEDDVEADEAVVEEEPTADAETEGMQERDDIAALESDADVIVAEASEDRFVDVRDEEDNDVDEDTEAEASIAPLAPLPADSVPARTIDERPLQSGVYRVVGYTGSGRAREVLVIAEPEQPELEVLVADGIEPGSQLTCQCIEVVSGWGPAFACLREPRTGYELCLGAEDLTFSQHDRAIASCIPIGAEFLVVVTELDLPTQTMRATRLPLVQRHFRMVEPAAVDLRGERRMMRPATVLAERWGGWVALQLDHGDPATGLLHRFSARDSAFNSTGVGPVAGLPVLVELVPSAAVDADGWVHKRLTKVPEGVDELCDEDHLRLDPETLILHAAQGMGTGLRDRLAVLSNDVHWKRAMTNLWREANTLGVNAVAASDATSSFTVDVLGELYGIDTEHEGIVTGLQDFGAYIKVGEHGWQGMAYRDRMGREGVLSPPLALQFGQTVRVQVLGRKQTNRGMGLELALPDVEAAPLIEQVRSVIGAEPVGSVVSVHDRGAVLQLADDGLTGWLPFNVLDGVLDTSSFLKPGNEVAVVVSAARFGDRGRLELRLGTRGLTAAPLVTQAQDYFDSNPVARGRAARLMPFGRLVRLPHNLTGLIAWRSVNPSERSWLEALAEGDELDVAVLDVREGNGPRGLQIDLELA
jgi:HrpA-like RNA helicase/predicted RNA-binding protein with RPS1 domain